MVVRWHPPPFSCYLLTHTDTLGVMGGPFPITIKPVRRWSVRRVTWSLPDGSSRGECPEQLTNCRIICILESWSCVGRANG